MNTSVRTYVSMYIEAYQMARSLHGRTYVPTYVCTLVCLTALVSSQLHEFIMLGKIGRVLSIVSSDSLMSFLFDFRHVSTGLQLD